MKTKPALLLLALPLGAAMAANSPATPPPAAAQVNSATRVTPGSILAAQITAIMETPGLSEESKRRQITAAIRLAISTTVTKVTDPREALRLVRELAHAAAEAAPGYGDLVFRTVVAAAQDLSVLANQRGVAEAIRETVTSAVRDAQEAAGADNRGGDRDNRHDRDRDRDRDFHGHGDDHVVSPSR